MLRSLTLPPASKKGGKRERYTVPKEIILVLLLFVKKKMSVILLFYPKCHIKPQLHIAAPERDAKERERELRLRDYPKEKQLPCSVPLGHIALPREMLSSL